MVWKEVHEAVVAELKSKFESRERELERKLE